MRLLDVTVPGEVPSASNLREHWAVKAKRVRSQRGRVARRLPDREVLPVVLRVLLTRIAPRTLDVGDNLSGALKAHRDQVATWLRVDDASPLVRWEYAQERGEPAVRIQVEALCIDRVTTPAPAPTWRDLADEQEAPEPYRRGVPTPNVRGVR